MNLSEFKAWFEGFTENLDGAPGQKAWVKIQAKVKTITADPTPWPVFVDRYWPRPRERYDYYAQALGLNQAQNCQQAACNQQMAGLAAADANHLSGYHNSQQLGQAQNLQMATAQDAFRELGRLDATKDAA